MSSEIFTAAKEGNISKFRAALADGANINYKNQNGLTPLMIACKEGHAALVKFLISKGANTDLTDLDGKTFFDYIKESKNPQIIESLNGSGNQDTPQNSSHENHDHIVLADNLLPLFKQLVPLIKQLDNSKKGILKSDFIQIVQLFRQDLKLAELDIFGLGLSEVLFHYPDQMDSYFRNIKNTNPIQKFITEIYESNKENYRKSVTKSNFHLDALTAFSQFANMVSIDQLKRILYEFAEIIVKADGIVTSDESENLKFLSKSLFKQTVAPDETETEQAEQADEQSLEEILKEVDELVGMDNIKNDIQSLINIIKVNKIREKEGLPKQKLSLHSVFIGAPGTGKTTIARILSKIYLALDVLPDNNFVETDRSGLVAGYVGQTAIKTENIINQAIDGVLFIDEAYTLKRGNSDNDYGQEAIDILLKRMEDYRDKIIVIVAGYENEMNYFINSNPGLRSRFNRYFHFKDYIPLELTEIYKRIAVKSGFNLTYNAQNRVHELFEFMYEKRDDKFGNARLARNIFEKTFELHANRTALIAPITREILTTIEPEDIPFDEFNNSKN